MYLSRGCSTFMSACANLTIYASRGFFGVLRFERMVSQGIVGCLECNPPLDWTDRVRREALACPPWPPVQTVASSEVWMHHNQKPIGCRSGNGADAR